MDEIQREQRRAHVSETEREVVDATFPRIYVGFANWDASSVNACVVHLLVVMSESFFSCRLLSYTLFDWASYVEKKIHCKTCALKIRFASHFVSHCLIFLC